MTFYSIAPRSPLSSTPLPNMKKKEKSALPIIIDNSIPSMKKLKGPIMPLIVDNSIDPYLTTEEEDFIFSDNSLEEKEEGGTLEKREKQYVLPVLHHRPKIRFSSTI